ncbi:MAG TPA: methyltransferase domain-containing protein [Ktedonobacteraceae bacterium]
MVAFHRLFRRRKTPPLPQPLREPLPQRRFLDETDYLLPKDEQEKRRLEFQHHALHLTLGNQYLAPLPPKVCSILDVGAGTGIWPSEMARIFPESLVLGLDVDNELFHQAPPANCLLRQGNILTGLALPDGVIEFTHQRFLVLAIPDVQWPSVVRELVRVTRPGGWLELVETDARVQNGGPATTQVFAWIDLVRKARGIMGEPVLHLGEMLAGAQLTAIETQAIPLKVGAWGDRVGHMMQMDILAAVQALKEPCCAQGINPQEYDRCTQAMIQEWKQAHAFCTIQVAYGKRGSP